MTALSCLEVEGDAGELQATSVWNSISTFVSVKPLFFNETSEQFGAPFMTADVFDEKWGLLQLWFWQQIFLQKVWCFFFFFLLYKSHVEVFSYAKKANQASHLEMFTSHVTLLSFTFRFLIHTWNCEKRSHGGVLMLEIRGKDNAAGDK